MPHGKGNNRGFRPGPPRGRGSRGHGRGGYRGGSRPGFVNAGEIYSGEGTLVFEGNFEDFTLDVVEPGTRTNFAKRGNHRGGYHLPRPPDFSGVTPRKSSRGLGYPKSSSGPRIPLSVLEKERPLLQPIRFVRGEHVKTLFEEVEEILHAPGEGETLAEGKLLSNDIIEKIFHRELSVHDTCPSDSEPTGEAGEEKISKKPTLPDGLGETVDSTLKQGLIQDRETLTENIDRSETVIIPEDKIHIEGTKSVQGLTDPPEALMRKEEQTELFVVDTLPSPIVFGQGQIVVEESVSKTIPLGEVPVEEEVIVYEAPNPRTSRVATPRPPVPPHPPTFDSISLSFTSKRDSQVPPSVVQPRESLGLRSTPRSRKLAKKERAAVRRKQQRMSMFSLGLSHEDRTAMGEQSTPKRDRRKAQRRKSSSDIDWGSEGEEDAGIEEVQSAIGDMDLDPDVADIAILSRLANRVQGFADGTVVTIDDLNDIQRMREEDEDSDSGGSNGSMDEIEEFLDASERKQIGEVDPMDGSDSSIEDSDEDTPRTGFQARLKRLREQSKGKIPVHCSSSDDDDQTRGAFGKDFSWADRDEDFLNHIYELLDENDAILRGDRQLRKKMFKAIEQGDFDDDYDISFNSTKKNRHIPSQLRGQWERDRQKKAQRKRERELARMEEAMNASPSRKGKLEKQKRRLLAHGGLSSDGNTLHTGDVDTLTMLESVMRRFLSSLEMKSMVMPPKDKEFRRRAHLLADAFKVKSKSQGKDSHRFTTFIKTSRSGININERKVASIVRNATQNMPGQSSTTRARLIRHKDGDVVGKAAPRLNDSNMGFKILQQMGWNEGERIGVTGLADPLTAVIKTTKLGLGAIR